MKNIFKLCFWVAVFFVSSCNKGDIINPTPEAPPNPVIDKGHEMPQKVEFIFTEMEKNGDTFTKTDKVQKITYQSLSKDEGLSMDTNEIVWEKGRHYHLEIVYYNPAGERMNGEFVTPEMAPIHQHFFLVDGKKVNAHEYYSYEYQDTDPEIGHLWEEGVALRKRTWDKNNPNAPDPIGLKGIFSVKAEKSFVMKVQLGHFNGRERGYSKLKNNVDVREFDEPARSMALDLNVSINIQIK